MTGIVITDAMKAKLQADAQIPHLPTDLTYECRMAVEGKGPRTFDWVDKPHRLVYDLCRHIEALQAALTNQTESGEAVAWQWRVLEDGSPSTYWKGPDEGDRPGWEAIAARRPDTYTIEKRFLYASPVTEQAELKAALQWIVDNPSAHPTNMWRVAQAALEGK